VTTQTSEKSRVVEALAASHAAFRDAVATLDDDTMATTIDGGWSVRDVVAHLIGWDEVGARDFERVVRGHMPVLAAYRHEDVDQWNAGFVRGRNLFSAAQLIAEMDAAWDALQAGIRPLPDAAFAEGQLARQFCDIGVQHKDAHAEELRTLRANIASR
jgi:hypothetical protein